MGITVIVETNSQTRVVDQAQRLAAIINLGLFGYWKFIFGKTVGGSFSTHEAAEARFNTGKTFLVIAQQWTNTDQDEALENLFIEMLERSVTTQYRTRLVVSFAQTTRRRISPQRYLTAQEIDQLHGRSLLIRITPRHKSP